MICPICKGKMKKIKDSIKQDGIEFDAFRCTKCKEEIMTVAQLEGLAKKYRKLRDVKKITFAKWGNSIALRIPSDIAKEYSITEGKRGTITKEKEGIKIIPA